MSKSKGTIKWINVLKGIGILLVVIGHAISKDLAKSSQGLWILRNAIYMVHMPLFFICGGFLFELNLSKYKKMNSVSFIKRKLQTYVIPYVSFMTFAYMVVMLALKFNKTRAIFEAAGYHVSGVSGYIKSLVFYVNPVDNHLWFSYVMLLVILLTFFLKEIDVRILCGVGLIAYLLTWPISFPELIWKVMRYFFLFQIGRIYVHAKKKQNDIVLILFFFVSFFTWIYFRRKAIYIPQSVVQVIAEISGVFLIISFAKFMGERRIAGHLSYIGKRTYPIYLIHQPFVVPTVAMILGKLGMPNVVIILGATIVGIIVPLGLYEFVISRSKVLKLILVGEGGKD